jgi:methyl-accepting chemotaxis protein
VPVAYENTACSISLVPDKLCPVVPKECLNYMKIGVKLVATISAINIIGIGLLVAVTLNLSQREIKKLTDEQVQAVAIQSSEKIKNEFEDYLCAVRTLSRIIEGYEEDVPAEQRRRQTILMLKQVILANPKLAGVYANWSPNGLDGMDADYANTPGTDESGRFIPVWTLPYDDKQAILSHVMNLEWELTAQIPGLTEEYMFDPFAYWDPVVEENSVIANMSSPVKNNSGALIGIVGCTLELSTIQTIVAEIKPFGDGQTFLFSTGGLIVAHSDPSRLGQDMRESEADTFGPFLDTMVDAVAKGSPLSFSYRPANSSAAIHYYTVPFTIGHVPAPWTLVIGVSHNTIMAPVYRMIRVPFAIGILSIILMSVGVVFTARSISRSIAYTMTVLKDVAEGDLTKEITVHSRDELGDLVGYLDFTVDKIKHLVLSIKQEATLLSQTGADLTGNMTETAASINEITANIQSIKSQSNKQALSIKGTHAVMEHIVENIDLINDQIQRQTNCVNQSSSAIEQMLANIQSVTQTLVKNEASIIKLAHASELGRTGLEKVSNDIREIAIESAGLLEINAVMENIASQTHLLSMNAAIEAAHAGEAGKGFAVVAGEIRKLAESSSAQSKTISTVLKKIKESIDKITKATNAVLQNFEAISEGVSTVTEQEASVRNAMEEQGTGSKAILEYMGSLNKITGEVERSAHGMVGGSREVIKESKMLEQITVEIEGGMQDMVFGAERIEGAVHKVNEISLENKKQIGVVMVELQRFKVVSG